MRLAATCLECGFENPRTWVSCARCGSLLGPRLRLGSDPTTGSHSGTGTTRFHQPQPVPASEEAPQPDAEPDADAKTGLYSNLGAKPKAAAPSAPRDSRPLFGQDAGVGLLRNALERTFEQRRAQLVIVHGEAGTGRTAFLQRASELAADLQPDVAVHYAALRSRDDGPYAPFSRLLLERFGITPASSPAAVREMMERAVALVLGASAHATETAHLLGHIAGVPFPESELLRRLAGDAAALHTQAVAALARFVQGEAAQRPAVFLLDDLADADDGAVDALTALLALDAPLAIIASGLPTIEARCAELVRAQPERVVTTPLSALADDDAARLVRLLVPDLRELPAELVAALMHRSHGNPRQLTELIKALLDGGLFPRGEQGAYVDMPRLERGGLPLTMADALRARLATLEPRERQLLRDAAIVGERFWDGALLALSRARAPASPNDGPLPDVFARATDEQPLHAALDALEGKGFIVRITDVAAPGLREYTFEHAGSRSLIYADLPEADRQRGHALVADWLSSAQGLVAESFGALLAPHLEHAGARERAARAYLRAAAEERTRMRATMALLYVDKALALTDAADLSARIDVLIERGTLLENLGRDLQALRAYEQIVRLAFALDARARAAAALVRIARIQRERGDFDQAHAHLVAALRLRETRGDREGIAQTQLALGHLALRRGRADEAIRQCLLALAGARVLEERRLQSQALARIGEAYAALQDRDRAEAALREAQQLAEALADRNALAHIERVRARLRR